MDWAADATELLWIGGVTAVPLALLVTLSCRWPRCRPATRHAMWAAVLLSFVTPALASLLWRPSWFQSHRVLAGAGVAIDRLESGLRLDPSISSPPSAVTLAERQADAPTVHAEAAVRQAKPQGAAPVRDAVRPRGPARTSEAPPAVREALPLAAAIEEVRRSGAGVGRFEPGALDIGVPSTEVRREAARTTPMSSLPAPAAVRPKPPVERAVPSRSTPEPLPESVGVVRKWGNEAKEWLAGALLVRDSIAQLPPLPITIWGLGAAAVLVAGAVRVASFRRHLRHARPASAETMRLVHATAAELGLGRAPLTVVTGTRVSPMVWCGRRPRLVLPVGLWRELDESSRRAVLLHELAHLKRRDHWLCWLAALVGVVYWWHPVAWWTRKRIRDEADAACDAWVTSLMPASRRAYAEALVTTKWYLSAAGTRAPSGVGAVGTGGLGVMSGRTKQLARRLQMVMTQRVAPRTSMAGALVALGVLATGMFVMPGLACPPEEAEKQRAHAEHAAHAAAHAADVHAKLAAEKTTKAQGKAKPKAKRADAKAEESVEFFGEAPALEAMRRSPDAGKHPEGAHEEQMMQRLEERLRRLEEHLRRLEGQGQGPRGAAGPGGPMDVFSTAGPGAAVQAEAAASTARIGRAYALARPMQAPVAIADHGPDVAREYRLPEGKLQALANLMIRADVPVLIESHGDRIVVHAPEGKQRVFAAFVHLIHPEAGAPTGMWMTTPAPEAVPARPQVEALRKDQQRQVEQLRKQLREMQQQQRSTERSAERARERSEAFENDMETMHERLESLNERRAESSDAATNQRLESEVRALAERISAKAADFEALISQVAASEEVQARIEAAIEDLEETIERLTDSLEEEIEALVEDAMTKGEPTPAPALAARAALAPGLPPRAGVPGVAPVAPVAPVPPVAPVGAPPSPSTRPTPPAPPAQPAPPTPPAPPAPPTPSSPEAAPAPANPPAIPSANI